ncbi:ATP-binding protein, partial [Parabacteroides johnsonii]|uniref:ATP-binding protein n=1 Tax=Parabacteroides johnsonii TaxID=387661 RepID=UPI001D5E1333
KDELEDVCALAMQEGWSHMRLIAELLRKETQRRAELRVRTRMKTAKFPQMKYLHELDTEELPDDARKAL